MAMMTQDYKKLNLFPDLVIPPALVEEKPKLKNRVFVRPWGKHKNAFYALVYNSGSYALLYKVQNNIILEKRSVEIKVDNRYYDIDKYAFNNKFIETFDE